MQRGLMPSTRENMLKSCLMISQLRGRREAKKISKAQSQEISKNSSDAHAWILEHLTFTAPIPQDSQWTTFTLHDLVPATLHETNQTQRQAETHLAQDFLQGHPARASS